MVKLLRPCLQYWEWLYSLRLISGRSPLKGFLIRTSRARSIASSLSEACWARQRSVNPRRTIAQTRSVDLKRKRPVPFLKISSAPPVAPKTSAPPSASGIYRGPHEFKLDASFIQLLTLRRQIRWAAGSPQEMPIVIPCQSFSPGPPCPGRPGCCWWSLPPVQGRRWSDIPWCICQPAWDTRSGVWTLRLQSCRLWYSASI